MSSQLKRDNMPNFKDKYKKAMGNPRIRAAVVGCIFFLVLVVIIISVYVAIAIISDSVGGGDTIEELVAQWAESLEKGNQKIYDKLWDQDARTKNKRHYDMAIKRFDEELMVDQEKIEPTRDPKNKELYTIENIPVTSIDSGVEFLTYRNLKVERMGLLKKWKIIDDEVYFLEEPPPVVKKVGESSPPPDKKIEEVTAEGRPTEGTPTPTKPSKVAREDEDLGRQVDLPYLISDDTPLDAKLQISGNAPLDAKLKISQIVSGWQAAWQEKDINRYMAKYADGAVITRVTIKDGKQYPMILTKSGLRQRMEMVKRRKDVEIRITISNLHVDGDMVVADVKFRQKFESLRGGRPVYSDIGTKSLTFIIDPSDGYWKIYEERWKRYVGKTELAPL